MRSTRTFVALLSAFPPEVRAVARAARKMIRTLLPRVDETVDASAPVVGYGYGPGYRGTVCTLILSKTGVKLGLVRGAELADPRELLEGSGKVHRYIQLQTASDLRTPGVSQLVKATYAAWQERG